MHDLLPKDKIGVAIDGKHFSNLEEIYKLVKNVKDHVSFVKFSHNFITNAREITNFVHDHGLRLFADFKITETPQSVINYMETFLELGVDYATINGVNNIEGVQSARDIVKKLEGDMKIYLVPPLTSYNDEDVKKMGFNGTYNEWVADTINNCMSYVDGFVSNGRILNEKELKNLERKKTYNDLEKVVTSVSNDNTNLGQRGYITPKTALEFGANKLILGRSYINMLINGMNPDDVFQFQQ